MRTIKFRVWSNTKQCFLESVAGKEGVLFEVVADKKIYKLSLDNLLPESCYSTTIQEFTGLKDTNNVDIYEGDIIRYERLSECTRFINGYRSTVEFIDGSFGFIMKGFNNMFMDLREDYNIQVIGNIFENSELLNENS